MVRQGKPPYSAARRLSSRHRGFTLMEIVIVVVIIGVMAAVTMPSMRSMAEGNRLRSSVREVMNLMKYARSEAVFNNRTTEVFLDTKKNEFWLDLRTPDPKTGRYDPKAPKTTMERKRKLEDRVWFHNINVTTPNILDDGIVAIDFFPDGTASPALVNLALEGSKGQTTDYTIEVYKSTGLVEMNAGDLETVAGAKAGLQYPLPANYFDAYAGSTGTSDASTNDRASNRSSRGSSDRSSRRSERSADSASGGQV